MKHQSFESPFKFAIIENFLPLAFADKIYKELRDWDIDDNFYRYNNVFEKKFACDKIQLFPPNTAHFLMTTFTEPFVSVVEKTLGISGLIGDPNLRGGGFHCHAPGGKLDIHKDFVFHEKLKLYRRVNIIWFANKQWSDEWNGHLEFWSKDMTTCEKRIAPTFNKLVMFETPNAPHGLPDEITCPQTHRRMSLASYYYTVEKPADIGDEKHSTMFLKRPNEETTPEIEELRSKRNRGRLASNL